MTDPARATDGVAWRMSSRTVNGGGQCVEAGPFTDGSDRFAVRDSKNRDRVRLTFDAPGWDAFLTGIKTGAFDPR